MSLEGKKEITDRIWQQSKARSLGKTLLLALVEYADDDGFCYPSHETLGKMIGLEGKAKSIQKNTQHHLAPLLQSGELISWKQQGKRGGRGFTNIYLLTVGLTSEQIRDRVQRRFKLFDDEVDAAITQTGETYLRICTDGKIAADVLDLTRPDDTQKGGKIGGNKEEKPPIIAPHNPEIGGKNTPLNPAEAQKGGKIGGRTESPKDESNPDKESKVLSPKQKIFVSLAELCRINLKASTEKQRGQLGNTSKALVDLITDLDQFKAKFPVYWATMDWRGKQGQPPTPPQIQEVYGDYCHWLENGESPPPQKASQNGFHGKARPTKDHRPDFEKRGGQGYTPEEWAAMLRGENLERP